MAGTIKLGPRSTVITDHNLNSLQYQISLIRTTTSFIYTGSDTHSRIIFICTSGCCDASARDGDICTGSTVSASDTGSIKTSGCSYLSSGNRQTASYSIVSAADSGCIRTSLCSYGSACDCDITTFSAFKHIVI